MNDDIYEQSVSLHAKSVGKLEIHSKVPLDSKQDLSLAYTPGVAGVCLKIASDKTLARTLTLKRNSVAIVSDGTAVLGLGNIGPEAAIPVMEGKAVLFKRFAGLDGFPVCLTTNVVSEIVETVKRIAPVFGGINLEDISAPRCFEVETQLRQELDIPVMHDDQHGTAVVVLAGLINAFKVSNRDRQAARIVINGSGAAGVAVAKMLINAGFQNIIVCDSRGAISRRRLDLSGEKRWLGEHTNSGVAEGTLADIIPGADVFIGLSKAGLLSEAMVETMAPYNIIFALANPVPEIMPDLAKQSGAAIVATGRSDFGNQVNNALAFPGIFRGALDNHIRQFEDGMFVRAAEYLASCVASPSADAILPSIFDPGVVESVARAIQ